MKKMGKEALIAVVNNMENKKTILTLVICLILVGIGTIINNLVFKTEIK